MIIDPRAPCFKPRLARKCYPRNYPWSSPHYTRLIASSLTENGSVVVLMTTIHVDQCVARSRIFGTAKRLGVKVTTRIFHPHEDDYDPAVGGGISYVRGKISDNEESGQ